MDKNIIKKIFKYDPIPTSIVRPDDSDFSFFFVNDAYLEMTQRNEPDLLGNSLFDSFPDPDEVKPTRVENLRSSFNTVVSTGKIDRLPRIRYDIIRDGSLVQKEYWNVINSPILNEHGEVEYIVNTAFNITDQVESEIENKIMLDNTQDSFVLINRELVIQNFNSLFAKEYKQVFGIEVSKGDSILDYAQPERRNIVKNIYDQVFMGECVKRELSIPAIDGSIRRINITYKPVWGDDETIIGAFTSVIDKTDEYFTKLELKENENRFRTLVENANDVVLILSDEGAPIYVSPSIKNILGYTIEEALSFEIANIVHPDDQMKVMREIQISLANPGKPISTSRARMLHKDGTWRWFDGTITNMLDDPNIGGIVDNFSEITEKVKAEEKLKETKELYQSLIQTIDGVVWEAKADTFEFTYVSPQSKSMFGYEAQQWIEDSELWENSIHPEDRYEAVNYCKNETEKGLNHDFEYRFRKSSGEYIWIRDVVTVVKKDGEPDLLRGLMIDISDQKKLVSLMEESYEIAKMGNWDYDVENQKLFWSPFIKRLHEVPPDYNPKLEEAVNFLGSKSQTLITEKLNQAIEKELPFDVELKIITAQGNERWARIVGTPEFINKTCVRVFGSAQDITEQKLIREELQEAEEKYRNVVEYSTNMFYTHDTDGVLTYVSPQSEYFLGYTPEESQKRWIDFITDHPINQRGIKITQKAIETGKTQPPYELQLITGKGKIIWVEVNEAPLVINGNTVAIVGSLTDITERKKYEEKLQESLERYDYVTKATRDAIYDWNINEDFIHWGEGFKNLFGHQPKKMNLTKKNLEKLIHPEDLKNVKKGLNETLNTPSLNHWSWRYRLKKKDGTYTHVSENGYIIRNKNGSPNRMIGTIQDISKEVQNKKELEASLNEKNTLLSEIHHRVKNNLAVVSGMMQLQAFETENDDLQARLFDSVVRIKTMATVHELLYQSQSFSELEFSETLQKLVQNIANTLQSNTAISIEINCDPLKLNINQAIPASLIVNEVITNTYKHAFKDKTEGKILFELFEENQQIHIKIEDNGIGFQEEFNAKKNSSLGMHLIKVLSSQINATYAYENGADGACFTLQFERSKDSSGIGSAKIK